VRLWNVQSIREYLGSLMTEQEQPETEPEKGQENESEQEQLTTAE
jgi:hypothetical protein